MIKMSDEKNLSEKESRVEAARKEMVGDTVARNECRWLISTKTFFFPPSPQLLLPARAKKNRKVARERRAGVGLGGCWQEEMKIE
jgi:hypothetical protein